MAFKATVFILLSSAFIGVHAAPIQPLDSIRAAAHKWLDAELIQLEANTEFEIGDLDSRLRLPLCDGELQGFASPGTRLPYISTAGVRCTSGVGWTVYVPVNVSAFRDVVVTRRPLRRGHHLSADDVQVINQNIANLRGAYVTELADAIGMEITQSAAEGALLLADHLRSPRVIKRGQNVTLISAYGTLKVTAPGEALADGAKGEIIRVRNALSRRVIQGRIQDEGMVEVIF